MVVIAPSMGWWGRIVNDAGGRWDSAGGIVVIVAI